MSIKSRTNLVVIGCYKPDLARQLQALLVVLNRQAPPGADLGDEPADPAAVPGRSNAPAVGTTGASTDIGTVTSSATNKQGCTHDTTRQLE